MRTPRYWKNKNLISFLLLPLGSVYAGLTALRIKIKKPQKVEKPVICIGNLTAGGTGKTPTAVTIAQIVKELGYNPMFVSRGYGGKLCGVMVDKDKHTPQDVGDEPLLLAREADVSINSNRVKAAQKAIENGADVLIMDDGFQNPGLNKDISFLVFDGGVGVGNAFPVPAGPLRENFENGLKRANAAIIIGEDKTDLKEKLGDMPVFYGKMKPSVLPENCGKFIAFAGIGRPEKFYNSLQELGANVSKTFDFPDHHFYSEKELKELIDMAWKEDADLITTAKDFVKIPQELQHHFKVLEIEIEWQNREDLRDFIKKGLKN
ncbi:MAG: tetraacyldisaccharide 4'-kinase [Alphaproteobacteria bacterium]|nr:tetraacyldisaccharide 4'-kinase [Alphaproteobacteria bacterium]